METGRGAGKPRQLPHARLLSSHHLLDKQLLGPARQVLGSSQVQAALSGEPSHTSGLVPQSCKFGLGVSKVGCFGCCAALWQLSGQSSTAAGSRALLQLALLALLESTNEADLARRGRLICLDGDPEAG